MNYSSLKLGVSHVSVVYAVLLEGLAMKALLIYSPVLRDFFSPPCVPSDKAILYLQNPGNVQPGPLKNPQFSLGQRVPKKMLGCCSYGGEIHVLSFPKIQYLQLFSYSSTFSFRFEYLWKHRCFLILNSFSYCYFYYLKEEFWPSHKKQQA